MRGRELIIFLAGLAAGIVAGALVTFVVFSAAHQGAVARWQAEQAAEKLELQRQASAVMHQVLSAPGYGFTLRPDGRVELVPLTSAEGADWIPPAPGDPNFPRRR